MNDDLPTQSDLDEFLDSLSRSGTLDEIRAKVSAIESGLWLEVTYQFIDRAAFDGKPLALAFTATPAMLQRVDVAGCRAFDPEEDNDQVSRSSLAIIIEAQEGVGWTGATLTVCLSWPSPDSDDSERFLSLPEQLPIVITGIRDGSQPVILPRFSLEVSESARQRLAAGAVAGSQWPDENGPMQMLHAVITRPGFETTPISLEPSGNTRHPIAWSSGAMAVSTEAQRQLFTQLASVLPSVMQNAFGVPVATRSIVVANVETPYPWRFGISNILTFDIGSKDDRGATFFPAVGHLVLRFSRIWWGTGVRVSGPHRDLIELAIGNSMNLRLRQLRTEETIDPEPMLSDMRRHRSPGAVRAMTFGANIFLALRADDRKKEAFRELTRSSWRSSVPGRDIITWCVQQGIQVPADIVASE